jgi:Mg-chelatase subunit ChlD
LIAKSDSGAGSIKPGSDKDLPESRNNSGNSHGDDAPINAAVSSAGALKIHQRNEKADENRLFQNLFEFAEKSGNMIKKMLDKLRGAAPRSFKGNPRRKTVKSMNFGRNTCLEPYKEGNPQIACVESVINSIKNGNFNPLAGKRSICQTDLLSWKKSTKESFNLILIADSSKSTNHFLGKFADILKRLTGYFKQNKDRMGLVLVQGKQATVLNNPTGNYRVVTRGLLQIDIGGETPLASGMNRAIEMATLEKLRNPGAKTLFIMISDCAPEPLTGDFENILDEPAYQESIRAARIIGSRKIPMIIINPSFWSEDEHFPHERLSKIIAEEARASLVKIRGSKDNRLPISDVEIGSIFREIETLYQIRAT